MSIKVENEPNLIRDTHSKAIINVDPSGYNRYLLQKQKIKNEKEKIEKLEQNVSSLKQDISEIRNILSDLVHAINTKK
jgi:DNA-binding ferritin-like protein